MSEPVSVRDLRNHGGEVLMRVQKGETVTVTSSGTPVAELRPIPGHPPSTLDLIAERRSWGRLDPRKLRDEIDLVIDQSI